MNELLEHMLVEFGSKVLFVNCNDRWVCISVSDSKTACCCSRVFVPTGARRYDSTCHSAVVLMPSKKKASTLIFNVLI